MQQENVPYFEKRLEHSDLRWQRWASTPTYHKYGINAMYLESDQSEYNVKCNHCGKWQVLDFFVNVDKERKTMVCCHCKKEIVPYQLEGQWIAKFPDAKYRGYHISQLYSPRLNLIKLIESSEKISDSEVQQFYNQNLGLPYEPVGGAKLTDKDIKSCCKAYTAPDTVLEGEQTYMGVDVGRVLHYIIRTQDRIVAIGNVANFLGDNSLVDVMKRFKVRGVVVDALPETRKVAEFVKAYPSKVKMCYYSGLSEMKEAKKYWKVDKDKVNTDRTLSLDMIFAEIRTQGVQMPANISSYVEFMAHLKSTTRIIRTDKGGNSKAEYVETGDDHYLHACNYAKIATNIFNTATPEVFLI
jgi:hypothetical protein